MDIRVEQAASSILIVGALLGSLGLIAILGALSSAFIAHARLQQSADVAAFSIAERGLTHDAAKDLAKANGADTVEITVEADGSSVTVNVRKQAFRLPGFDQSTNLVAKRSANIKSILIGDGVPSTGGYSGQLVSVKGVLVCPVVANAFKKMDRAAGRAGINLQPTSGYRDFAAQARLFSLLGPRIAAPPGSSRHHDATELDIAVGPAGSDTHRWLTVNAGAFGFKQRYSWEPWHWGYLAGC